MRKDYNDFKEKCNSLIENHKGRFVLLSHMSPDPDSLASVNSLAYYLEKKFSISKDRIICYYEGDGSLWLNKYNVGLEINFVNNLKDTISPKDLVFVLDSNSYKALTKNDVGSDFGKNFIVIDHHEDSKDSYKLKFIDSDRVSCVEIIYDLFFKESKILDENMAHIIMSGILGDSGSFSFITPTKVDVLDVAKDLISKYNISISTTKGRFFAYDPKFYPVLADLFRNFKILDYTNIGWGKVGFTFHTDLSIPSKVQHSGWRVFAAMFLSSTEGTNWGFGFREREDSFDISLRSNKGQHSVVEIAKHFGGGGHPAAAGAYFNKDDYPNLQPKDAIGLVEDFLQSNKPTFIN